MQSSMFTRSQVSKGTLFVNAGTGAWLDRVAERFSPPYALLCTHFFRDHSAGAARAAREGIPVFVPEGDEEIYADPIPQISPTPVSLRSMQRQRLGLLWHFVSGYQHYF
jgi:glyoxylase-like metal-dependent hydrolase (beta-lactamase superfamily II)